MFNAELNFTITTERDTETTVNGRLTKTWATSLSNKTFHKRSLSESERLVYAQQGFIEVLKLYTPDVSLDIKEGDRFTSDNKTYYITSVDNPHGLNHHLEIVAGMKNG